VSVYCDVLQAEVSDPRIAPDSVFCGFRVLRLPGEKLRVTKNIFEIRGSKRPDWA